EALQELGDPRIFDRFLLERPLAEWGRWRAEILQCLGGAAGSAHLRWIATRRLQHLPVSWAQFQQLGTEPDARPGLAAWLEDLGYGPGRNGGVSGRLVRRPARRPVPWATPERR